MFDINNPSVRETTTTDASGMYAFTNLLPGTYHITEIQQEGWIQTFPLTYEQQGYHLVGVSSGTVSEGNSFGNRQIGSISGMKFNDVNSNGTKDDGENGLQGWTIQLFMSVASDAVPILTTTNADGNYLFDSLPSGNYTVSEQQQVGWTQTFPPGNSYSITLNAGENLTGKDFGNHFIVYGSISGMKFNDVNGNGAKDSGEPGLQGWIINLQLNVASPPTPVLTTTDADGNYLFTGLNAGNYTITEQQQSGWTQTYPTGGSYTMNLASEQQVTGIDFGNAHFGFISGKKFNDYDGDGVKGAGEPALQGWIIQATKNAVTKLDTTDANGNYLFKFTQPEFGTWTVSEQMQSGWVQTFPAGGTYSLNVSAGSSLANNDFGNFKSPTISGKKWRDDNGNGVINDGEPALSNWVIKSMKGASTKFDTTDANGLYSFSFGLSEVGTWTVSEVQQSGWTQTYPQSGTHSVALRSALDTMNINFGNAQYGSISGKKYEDVSGDSSTSGDPTLNDWVIELYNGQTLVTRDTTTGSGDYQFNNVAPGNYTIQEQLQSGWIQTVPGTASYSVTISSGENVGGKNFANFKLGSISGTKYHDTDGDSTIDAGEPTLEGWLIQLWKNSTLVVEDSSDANGNYSFTGLAAGTYDVSEVQPSADWYHTIPPTESYTLSITSRSVYAGKDFANVQFGTVSGWKFRDYDSTGTFDAACEDYLAGQKIVLVGSHTAPETTVTDVNGNFTFDPVPADNYTLKEATDSYWRQTKPANGNPYSFQLLSNVDTAGFVFGNFFVLDTGKFRTFTINDYNKAAGARQKSGFAKKPTAGNVRDSVHVKRGFDSPTGNMLVGVIQTNPDSQLVYGWYHYKLDVLHPYKPNAAKSWLYNPSAVRIVTYPRLPGKPKLPKKPTDYISAYGENLAESEIGNALNYGQAHFITFKTNIAASDLGITPPGYGELIYGCTKNSDFSDSVFVGKTLREISHFYDTVLTLGRLIRSTGDTVYRYPKMYLRLLDSLVVRLNNEFTSIKVDTFTTKPLKVRGAKSLYKASYLHSVPEVAFALQRDERQFEENQVQPLSYWLEQNYPNPFNPTTNFGFRIANSSLVTLKVFNLLGQEVSTVLNGEAMEAGEYEIPFDANNLPSGVYFYRLEAKGMDASALIQNFTEVRKMLLIR
jgi:protocatechuate 3,4-dioxygenase beta subunit